MSEKFEWVSDISRGEWLRSLENEPFGSVLSIVPRGYEAYARIFHPVERDRPRATGSWRGVDPESVFEGVQVEELDAVLETERVTWARVAEVFGTTMHAEAQYVRLVRRCRDDADDVVAPDGWRYGAAQEGALDVTVLAAASEILAQHTETPDAGIAAIWEGWGGLVSSAGSGYVVAWEPSGNPLRDGLLTSSRAVKEWARGVRRALLPRGPAPGTGVLSREAAAGPRFDLHAETGRRYVLFDAGANDFANANWPGSAPWIDPKTPRWTQSPSILWPDDHAWLLATEIDFDSTIVAGSAALVRELTQTPGIEALTLRTGADLSGDGDALNRRA